MTTIQRQNVRAGLLALGFFRETSGDDPTHYDHGDGIYVEVFRHHLERTKVTLEWDRKTKDT